MLMLQGEAFSERNLGWSNAYYKSINVKKNAVSGGSLRFKFSEIYFMISMFGIFYLFLTLIYLKH